jgi:myo-inositol-1(or 4)-monophosphatase
VADDLLAIAEEGARAAGAILLERFGGPGRGVHAKSSPTDPVSEADVAAERALRAVLAKRRPGDAVLGEEGGQAGAGETGLRWVVDPLDGTVNFLFGIPAFAVSVACEDEEGALAGVILDPTRDERFEATRSGEAFVGGQPIRRRGGEDLSRAMVATGFAYDAAVRTRQADVLARVLPRVADVRRVGAAALDLAWCACGRFDAYYERGLHPWDVAAGALIAARAGLVVRTLVESESDPAGVLAAPPALIDELYELVAG